MELSAPNNICANCGKGEDSDNSLKFCTACKLVKYCSRDCQIAHRPQHKKACKKRVAELHDEKLFADPSPREECPICLQPHPHDADKSVFKSCCGKIICLGCIYAMHMSEKGKYLCPFCRTPKASSGEEEDKRVKKLAESNHPYAFYDLAGEYQYGLRGVPQDHQKANELWLKAGELGCHEAYHNLGNSCRQGRGVVMDEKKAKHYYELAAMMGNVRARINLGTLEGQAGNHHRAMKHMMIAARAGYKNALDRVKNGFVLGAVTKEEYANTLRAYQKAQDDMRSDAREKAAALNMNRT